MGLIIPPPQQAILNWNLANNTVSGPGADVTASSSTNTRGTSVEYSASTTRELYGVELYFMNSSTAGSTIKNLTSLCIGANGSEVDLIPDILNTTSTTGANGGGYSQFWPIFIPRASRVSFITQSNTASKKVNATIWGWGGGGVNPFPVFNRCCAIGVTRASSSGTAHTPGSSAAYSSWANIGSTLPYDIKAIQLSIGVNNSTTTALGYQVHVGIGGTQISQLQWHFTPNATEMIPVITPTYPIFCRIPGGTQLQIQASCSGTAVSLDFALYGFA